MAMQEKRYMTSYLFSRWMDHFIEQLEEIDDLSPSNRNLIVLDEHKSHTTLKFIQKAKEHGVDMISLPFILSIPFSFFMWLISSYSRVHSGLIGRNIC